MVKLNPSRKLKTAINLRSSRVNMTSAPFLSISRVSIQTTCLNVTSWTQLHIAKAIRMPPFSCLSESILPGTLSADLFYGLKLEPCPSTGRVAKTWLKVWLEGPERCGRQAPSPYQWLRFGLDPDPVAVRSQPYPKRCLAGQAGWISL